MASGSKGHSWPSNQEKEAPLGGGCGQLSFLPLVGEEARRQSPLAHPGGILGGCFRVGEEEACGGV